MSRTIAEWQRECHDLARIKGWHTDPSTGEPIDPRPRIPERIALIHSELSEALEEYRRGTLGDYEGEGGKPEGFAIELADAVIRLFDLCGALGIDLEDAVSRKHEYNRTRQYRHGGKVA